MLHSAVCTCVGGGVVLQMWEFKCWKTGRCIESRWQCDGRRECPGGEDEAPLNPKCPSTSFVVIVF